MIVFDSWSRCHFMPHVSAADQTIGRAGTRLVTVPGDLLPAWLQGGTVYGGIVSQMGGGTFRDVTLRLDDLAALGIAALWLAPITRTLPGHFGYEVTDYYDVRPDYGTLEDFRHLVREAHARNIRVLLDVVPNHTSREHPWYQEAQRQGSSSEHHAWYDRDADGQATHYFDWTHLPNLNFDLPEVRAEMTEALLHWVRDYDVDGFRVDVAWGIRQRRPDFWPGFAAAFRRLKPEGLLIAEASARDPYYLKHGFDLAYDWTDQLGHWAWERVFTGDLPVAPALREAVEAAIAGDSNPAGQTFRFLNNNDTGARFITRHGEPAYRAALALLMTLPGVPCLYLGDETGAEYEPYARSAPVPTDDPRGLRSYVETLVQLRRELLACGATTWTWRETEADDQVLAFDIDSGETTTVVVNLSDRPAAVANLLGERNDPIDRLTNRPVEQPILEPWGVRIVQEAGR